MKRNVYDFDGTIYRGDSTADFYLYCLGRYPGVLPDLPGAAIKFLGMFLGLVEKTRAKERLYHFLTFIPDMDAALADFWDKHFCNMEDWYMAQKRADDLIISASPEFLLQPVCDRLGVALIASRVDPRSGLTQGKNCHDQEKVRRMNQTCPGTQILRFYSDSVVDAPLAALAQEAFYVKRGRLSPFFSKGRKRP